MAKRIGVASQELAEFYSARVGWRNWGEESIRYTQELLWKEGIFAGVSSGAAVSVAVKYAQRIESGNIVVLLADGGWKYLSTQLWTQEVGAAAVALEKQLLW